MFFSLESNSQTKYGYPHLDIWQTFFKKIMWAHHFKVNNWQYVFSVKNLNFQGKQYRI